MPLNTNVSRLPPRRILVRGVNWLGDAVMSMPALQRLREAMPGGHIALLTPNKLVDLWQHHPAIDAVLAFDENVTLWQVARQLRSGQFDVALILPNSPRSALEVFLARIPLRIGYARPWRNWLLTQRVPPRPDEVPMRRRSVAEIQRLIATPTPLSAQPIPAAAHHVHQYLHLVAALGANPEPLTPRLHVSEDEVREFRASFLNEYPTQISWFGLNPGAKYGPAKRWPLERYIAAAAELHQQTGCGWLVFGGPEDKNLSRKITTALAASAIPCVVDLAGRLTLRQLCAAFKVCRVLLTNDSGPMHVAAAVGTPVVVPFGSTSPELSGPGLPSDPRHFLLSSNAPCAPCFRRECPIDFRCMTGISIVAVVQAARRAFGS